MSGNRYIKFEKRNLRVFGAAILIIAALFFVFKIMLILEDMHNTVEVDPAEFDQRDTQYEEDERDMIYLGGEWYVRRNDIRTFLLIGIDKDEEFAEKETSGRNNQQADFLFLLLFNESTKTVDAIHINRDTMAEIKTVNDFGQWTGIATAQAALAHTYGVPGTESCMNTVDCVSGILYDTPIEHYLSFTMDTVPVINDYYGGVTVHLDEDFTFIDPLMTAGSDYHLMGDNSIKYLRARMQVGDGSNLSRMERHRQYIAALLEKMNGAENSGKDPLDLFSKISDTIVTDCTVNQLSDFRNMMSEYKIGKIMTIEGEAVLGDKFIEFYPDEEALQKLIIDTFYEKENKN